MTEALAGFGYTDREATFLPLPALLGGYFLRRHFNEFIGKECGALAQRFIERGMRLGHFTPLPALGGRVIYHVNAGQLLRRLGDPESRNRREHQADTIRRRLMALDFALLRPGAKWLLTEQEKVAFFSPLGATELPGAIFAGRTKRWFVDKQPIAVGAGGRPQFAFIDEGWQTFSSWELFLKNHRALLQKLEASDVVFASCQQNRFEPAEALFRTTVVGQSADGGTDTERLRRFFIARKLFEEKRYEGFDKTRLDELREAKRVFAGEEFERLYLCWQKQGDLALSGLRSSRVRFYSAVLPHLYDWLSPIRFQQRRGKLCP